MEIGIDTIQFGAPASNGNENEVVPVLSEKPTDKVPEPKEQRQKQPRAGPIKAQKVSTVRKGDVILKWTKNMILKLDLMFHKSFTIMKFVINIDFSFQI